MARPAKNNCDYFPHDAGMRNHKKVKAIRTKFGILGYGVWSMLLEHLTGSDGNVFPYTNLEFELMSGDFGVSATEIKDVVDYCLSLELLFNKNGFVNSDSLDERLAPVYEKRGKAKELSQKQLRENGKFTSSNTDRTVVSVAETPQSKVKESKGNETKVNESRPAHEVRDFIWFKKQIDEIWTDQLPTDKKKNLGAAVQNAWEYLSADEPRLKRIESRECKQLVSKAFQFLKPESNGTIRPTKTGTQSTQPFSGDYTGNGGPVLRCDVDL